jgi:hypothetical protein
MQVLEGRQLLLLLMKKEGRGVVGVCLSTPSLRLDDWRTSKLQEVIRLLQQLPPLLLLLPLLPPLSSSLKLVEYSAFFEGLGCTAVLLYEALEVSPAIKLITRARQP